MRASGLDWLTDDEEICSRQEMMHFAFVACFVSAIAAEITITESYKTECLDIGCSVFKLTPAMDTPHKPLLEKRAVTHSFMTDDGKFTFDMDCATPATLKGYAHSSDLCGNVQEALLETAAYIATILDVKAPISTRVRVFSSAAEYQGMANSWNNSLGSASPMMFHRIQSPRHPDVLFPAALVRQLMDKDASIVYPTNEKYDIRMSLNSDSAFYFSKDIMKRASAKSRHHDIGSHEVDLKIVVLHEMIHGLGMLSLLADSAKAHGAMLNQILGGTIPPADFGKIMSTGINLLSDGSYRFGMISIFDYHLASAQGWFTTQFDNIVPLLDRSASIAAKTAAFEAAKLLYQQATTPAAVKFYFASDWNKGASRNGIYLYTPVTFSPTSSLSHVEHMFYQNTEDFIMTPGSYSGITWDTMRVRRGGKCGMFGMRIIAMFGTLGYPLQAAVEALAKMDLANE